MTAALAEFASRTRGGAIPDAARTVAHRAIIDTIGVTLAGKSEPPVVMLSNALRDGDEAMSLATGQVLTARDAALIDGLAGHVLDYDDVARHGHPSVVIVPALLAEAQRLGASGGAMLDACAIGQEAWAQVAMCESGAYHLGAWHPTPMLGIVAVTAALCALHQLDAVTARNALALSASFASGVIANFGTPAKPLQAGRAAASAIEAVALAKAGLAGSGDAIESAHGLLQAVSPRDGELDTTAARFGDPHDWRLVDEGISVKRYPVCHASHRSIDATIDMAAANEIAPADVAAVTAFIGPSPAATLRYDRPANGLEAKFSMQHNLAAALVDRAVGFAQLDDAFVRRDDVAALYPLVQVEAVAGDCPDQPGMAKHDRVAIETRDGRSFDSGPVRHPRGHAKSPMSDGEIDAKFLDCARHGGLADPGGLLDRLRNLDDVADLREEVAQWT